MLDSIEQFVSFVFKNSLTTSSLKQVPLLRTQQIPVFKCLEWSITLPSRHLVVLYHIVAVSDKHRHPVLVKIFVFPSAAFHSFQKIIVVSPSQAVSICKPPPFGSFFHSQSCSSYDAAPEVSCGTESLSLLQETKRSAGIARGNIICFCLILCSQPIGGSFSYSIEPICFCSIVSITLLCIL